MPGGILEESTVTRTGRESGEGISGYLGGRPLDACLVGADSLTWPVERAARGLCNVECLATAIFSRRGGLSFDAFACTPS